MTNTTAAVLASAAECDGDALQNAFLTAMLLTGSASLAEAAVLKAIENGGGGPVWGSQLLRRTVETSLRTTGRARLMNAKELESSRDAVPHGLRSVLSLHRFPRQCFVLRMLLSLPPWECASLLHISESDVASYCGAAVSTLACADSKPLL